MDGVNVFAMEAVDPTTEAGIMDQAEDIPADWQDAYHACPWFSNIYKYLSCGTPPPTAYECNKALDYRISKGRLWVKHRGSHFPCIPQLKVLQVIQEAHDDCGHWGRTATLAKLREFYWPRKSDDVDVYISGCLLCARHGPAIRSQLLQPVATTYPFELFGIDFIGPLPTSRKGKRYILNCVCYFSRFVIPFATSTDKAKDVIWSLSLLFNLFRKPNHIYCDRGPHFQNDAVPAFLAKEGVRFTFSPSGSSKSTGIIEVCNRLLGTILRKAAADLADWDDHLPKSASGVNSHIITYLGISSQSILFGTTAAPPTRTSATLAASYVDAHHRVRQLDDPEQHAQEVHKYILHRAHLQDAISARTKEQKELEAARYNRTITQVTFKPGDLVMVFQKNPTKLEATWRGPFRISGYSGGHGRSFALEQLNRRRRIKGTFHGDHLKLFIQRTGYLTTAMDTPLLPEQNLRASRPKKRTTAA